MNEDIKTETKEPLAVDLQRGVSLYAWQPRGHGELSFFVAASTEDEARKAIGKYIEDHLDKDDDHYVSEYNTQGWGTDYYDMEILHIGEVVTNCND